VTKNLEAGSRLVIENDIVDVGIHNLKLHLVIMPNVRDIEGSIWVEILVRTLLALIFM
jgi:hypothetical protein